MLSINLRVVIMAGGSGTRFWPLSRRRNPKQFLDIVSRKSMIEDTVERLLPLVPIRDIFTIAGAEQTAFMKDLFPRIPKKNFLVEPMGKNTAPCLILATAHIFLKDPEAVIAVVASDHIILEKAKFLRKLEAGVRLAKAGNHIVTFGIPPTFPSTGYGYIHFSKEKTRKVAGEEFCPVLEFKEKPGRAEAEGFLLSGDYYWNSGMFIWRAGVFAEKLRKYAPEYFPFWERMLNALKTKRQKDLVRTFEEIPSISIDYALMEKAKGVWVAKGDFRWSDVGAWSSLYDVWARDEEGNASKGDSLFLSSKDCLVYNPRKLTALVGVKDIIVIDAGDALLVCHKDEDQKVKDIVEALKKKRPEYL